MLHSRTRSLRVLLRPPAGQSGLTLLYVFRARADLEVFRAGHRLNQPILRPKTYRDVSTIYAGSKYETYHESPSY